MSRILVSGWLCGALISSMAAQTPEPTIGVELFYAAYRDWDADRLASAEQLLEQTLEGTPGSWLGWYWLGVVRFHRFLMTACRDTETYSIASCRDLWNRAVRTLDETVRLRPPDAESHAMLATLYGIRCRESRWRAWWYGPLVVKHQEVALANGVDNPRVQYLWGAACLATARSDSDWQLASERLRRAEALFEVEAREATDPQKPRWGRPSALTLLGEACERQGHWQEAARWYSKALHLQPGNQRARAALARLQMRNVEIP
ncbi:MAG: bacterial transcriptional activator domain-containing protein [Verrucomicrobiota bacterium]|nr:bacterial transcriptional activator domain-containing protein [Limisphaera sp.]MDW8380606.1 bacterial transcriptional activator domain-containing protein [Verrucomicrobiota bacterium]